MAVLDPRFLDDLPLPGNGDVSGVFWSSDRKIVALTSVFRLLTEPPARAAYGGHRLRYRVALYRPPETQPFAVFDDTAFPVNSVSFHPSRPVVLLGGGTYDGGYMFDGQLLLWDWNALKARDLGRVPEVLRAEISPDGNSVQATVRPWDEGFAQEKGGDPFDMFFDVVLSKVFDRKTFDDEIRTQLDSQTARAATELMNAAGAASVELAQEISAAFGLAYRRRSPIWDVAFIDADTIGVAHDDCHLQLFHIDGSLRQFIRGEGHGVEILRGRDETFVHIAYRDPEERDWFKSSRTRLAALHGSELADVLATHGRFTFSMDNEKAILGRCNRAGDGQNSKVDVIISGGGRIVDRLDLGHYDVFNHFLRVDGAPLLFFVQGTPAESHEHKVLCSVTRDGKIQRYWPLLEDRGDQGSHAMECCFEYVYDSVGAGMIVAGRHYNSSPSTPYRGFLHRKNLDGSELWRHATSSSAASIKVTRDSKIVLVGFLDGNLAVLHADTGKVTHWEKFTPGGIPTIIVSIAIDERHVVFGTVDGRIGIMPLASLGQ